MVREWCVSALRRLQAPGPGPEGAGGLWRGAGALSVHRAGP